MFTVFEQTIAQLTFALGLACGVALGYFFADVVELYHRKGRR
jgi:hypothetical protein